MFQRDETDRPSRRWRSQLFPGFLRSPREGEFFAKLTAGGTGNDDVFEPLDAAVSEALRSGNQTPRVRNAERVFGQLRDGLHALLQGEGSYFEDVAVCRNWLQMRCGRKVVTELKANADGLTGTPRLEVHDAGLPCAGVASVSAWHVDAGPETTYSPYKPGAWDAGNEFNAQWPRPKNSALEFAASPAMDVGREEDRLWITAKLWRNINGKILSVLRCDGTAESTAGRAGDMVLFFPDLVGHRGRLVQPTWADHECVESYELNLKFYFKETSLQSIYGGQSSAGVLVRRPILKAQVRKKLGEVSSVAQRHCRERMEHGDGGLAVDDTGGAGGAGGA